jgi:Rrf2 family protein
MPERFLLQILRTLVTHGILNSERGVKGGYFLANDLTEVSLLQAVEAVEGSIAYVDNPLAFLESASSAKLNLALREAQEASRRVLDNLKLSQFSLKHASSLFGEN